MATQPEPIAPAVVKVMAMMRRAVELQVKADLARRWDGEGMPVENIAQLLDVSRTTVYRYVGRDRKRRQAPSPAAVGVKQPPDPCFLQPGVVSRS